MKLAALGLAIALIAFGDASAWNEPTGFRGVPWGSSEEVLKDKFDAHNCLDTSHPVYPERICQVSPLEKIGPVEVTGFYSLRRGKFVSVDLLFDIDGFTMMKGIFFERYGRPTKSETEKIKSRGGAEFLNESHEWRGTKAIVKLQKYGTRVDQSSATISTVAEMEESLRRHQEAIKKGKKDL